jgi:hypothetical protein
MIALLAVVAAGCGSGEDNGSTTPNASDEPSAAAIRVEDSKLLYLPDQVGGRYHTALVLLRNTSDKVALNVGGQLSVMENGKLVKSVNPTEVNILPRGRALLLEEALDLPKPVKAGKLDVRLSVAEFRDGPSESPVTFSDVLFSRGGETGAAPCKITGTVQNTFGGEKSDLQIRVAGFVDGRLATGGFTYLDKVFPGKESTFEIEAVSPAECPAALDRVEALPNLGEDKIFSPESPAP